MAPRPAHAAVFGVDVDSSLLLPPQDASRNLGVARAADERDFQARFQHGAPKLDSQFIDYGRLPIRPNGQLGTDVHRHMPTKVEEVFTLKTSSHPDFWPWPEDMTRRTFTHVGE